MIPQHSAPISPGSTPRRDGLLVGLAVALGAIVVLGGLFGLQRYRNRGDDAVLAADADGAEDSPVNGSQAEDLEARTDADQNDEGDGEDAVDGQEDEEPGQPDTPPPSLGNVDTVPCPQDYSDVICDAAEFVQQARGRPFKEFPVIELLEDSAFDDAVLEDLDESRAEFEQDENLLKALGLVDEDLDLFETFESLLETGVVGFYDPDDGRLVVRGGDFDLYGQSILVHELVHAFDDQWFDLGRDDFDNEDAEYGFIAVVEGNATRVEELWRMTLNDRDAALLQQQERGSLSAEDLDRLLSLPQILLELQISPYQDGERYVDSIVEDGGETAVDEQLVDPPASSETVLHPGSRTDLLRIEDIEPPEVDGRVLDEDRLGEIIFRLWLGERAATGWGNDSAVIWESGGEICTTVDVATDSENDRDELEESARRWAEGDVDRRTVELVDGTLVRITGCF